MNCEQWKDIKGYVGYYQVSTRGRVKSLVNDSNRRSRVLKAYNHGGYKRLGLYNSNGICKKHYIHRLVAHAFISNPDELKEVNHIDGIKCNNNLHNLEWVTSKENQIHAIETGLQSGINNRGVSCDLITNRSRNVLKFNTMTDASKYLGFNRNYIAYNRRIKGNQFKVNGYTVKVGDVNNV